VTRSYFQACAEAYDAYAATPLGSSVYELQRATALMETCTERTKAASRAVEAA
jgi:hypothetical protein